MQHWKKLSEIQYDDDDDSKFPKTAALKKKVKSSGHVIAVKKITQ
jgi:hypothetical protein